MTPEEQQRLRGARVAIAGLGGVGGAHLVTLVRLGISKFNIADLDRFEVHNFNRQAGAFVSTLLKPKVDTVARMAMDINPECDIRQFKNGVTEDNVREFLADADVYVDGIDFFELKIRQLLFATCREMGIPAITAAPLGMGVALLYFDPAGMSFEDYFRMHGHDRREQLARFIAGLSPAMLQRHYLVQPDRVDFVAETGPSTVMACDLCAGVMGTAVLKLLLRRGALKPAPWGFQFDAFQQKLRSTWRPMGNANPLQQLLLLLIRSRLAPTHPAP